MNVMYARLHWFPPGRLSIWASALVNSSDFRTYTGLYTIDALANGNPDIFWDAVRHLVLPAVTLALMQWSLLARIFRSSLLDTLTKDYIVTARAKGVSEAGIINRHATRNALLPIISITGVATSMFLSNLMVIELLFEFNGVGRWAVKSALSWDIPVVLGFVLFLCSLVVFMSLAADILYAILDARIRLG